MCFGALPGSFLPSREEHWCFFYSPALCDFGGLPEAAFRVGVGRLGSETNNRTHQEEFVLDGSDQINKRSDVSQKKMTWIDSQVG
jgi:hypothetical protein